MLLRHTVLGPHGIIQNLCWRSLSGYLFVITLFLYFLTFWGTAAAVLSTIGAIPSAWPGSEPCTPSCRVQTNMSL